MSSEIQDPSTYSHVPPHLGVFEKLSFIVKVIGILSVSPFSFMRRMITIGGPARRQLFNTLVTNFIKYFTIRQLLSLQPPTGVTVAKICAKKKLQHKVVTLKCGEKFPPAALHIIGELKPNKNVILYLHGGAYLFPINDSHVKFAHHAAEIANNSCLGILEYTLAPKSKYPGQLAQSVAAIKYLMKDRNPENIIIGGDSAGGNLALSILAHIRSPHPDIEALQTDDGRPFKLLGAFILSPRIDNDGVTPSFEYNRGKDYLRPTVMQQIVDNWAPTNDVWAEPGKGDEHFWSEVGSQNVLLVAGEYEIFLDDVKRMAKLLKAEEHDDAPIQFVIGPKEVHVQCVIDINSRMQPGFSYLKVMKWLGDITHDTNYD